jgi:phage baseplate assembly protein V
MNSPEDKPTDPGQMIRLATIKSVDLENGLCVVSIDDESETGPVKWMERRAGDTATWSPPTIGEQVVLLCPDGEISGAVVLGGLSSENFPSPGTDLTEVMKYKDGAVISYDPEAHILVADLPAGSEARLIVETVNITGNVAITGKLDVTDQITSETEVEAAGIMLAAHQHAGVTSGSSNTGNPV